MKLYRICRLCGSAGILCLFMLSSAVADPVKWDSLSKMQKHVVKEHKAKWNDYSEDKQNKILKKSAPIVKRMEHYKKWVKELPNKERRELEKKFKEMKPEAFKKYADKLMKKSLKEKEKEK